MNREDAEAHWRYTEKIILAMLEVCHVGYVEAMIHGAKRDSSHTSEVKTQ